MLTSLANSWSKAVKSLLIFLALLKFYFHLQIYMFFKLIYAFGNFSFYFLKKNLLQVRVWNHTHSPFGGLACHASGPNWFYAYGISLHF